MTNLKAALLPRIRKAWLKSSCFRVLAVVGAFVAINAGSARAETCRNCDDFKSIVTASSLAADISAIGVEALHNEGAAFYTKVEMAAALRLKIDADASIPDYCKSKLKALIPLSTFDVIVRRNLISPALPGKFVYDGAGANALYGAYNGTYAASYNNACAAPPDSTDAGLNAAFSACLKNKAPAAYDRFGRDLMKGEAAALAGKFGVAGSDLQVLKAYHMILNSGSEAAALALVKAGKDGLSYDQFLTAVQMIGKRGKDDYDNARTIKGNPRNNGAVTGDKIIGAGRTNTVFGLAGDPTAQAGGSLEDSEGVCRDIAAFQAKLLDAKGFKNTYVIHYKTSSGGHATVLTMDPTRPRTIYSINYDERSTRKDMDGSQALQMGASGGWANDYTLNYRVFKPGGRLVADIPSEMGKFLTEAAGFDVRSLDGLARPAPNLAAANVTFGGSQNNGSVRLVTGDDANGANYLGVGADFNWAQGTLFPGKIGGFVGQQYRPDASFGGGGSAVVIGYAQAEQHLMTPKFKLSPELKLQFDASGTYMVAMHQIVTGDNADQSATQSDHHATIEARVEQKSGPLQATYRVGVVGMIGDLDNRAEEAKAPIVTKAYVGARGTYAISPDTKAFVDAIVIASPLGTRGKVEAGVATRTVAASAWASGRLTNGSSLYEDNSIRRVGASLTYKPSGHYSLGVSAEIPVEGDDPLGRFRLFGVGALNF